MQLYNLQFRYRVHWIATEKREIWALYWPRSWPRRRVQHLAVVKYTERTTRILFLHCGLFYYRSLFSRSIFFRRFSSPPLSSLPRVRETGPVEPVTRGGYLRLWFNADSQEKREERKEETRRRGTTDRKRKTDRNVRLVHKVSNFNERQILVKLQYFKPIFFSRIYVTFNIFNLELKS